MKRLLIAGFVLALLVPACAFAQDAFTGTWTQDATSVHETGGKPMVMSLKDGVFTDDSVPPMSVKADGEDHAVTGQKRFDMAAVKVVDDHALQLTQKKDGKTTWMGVFTVAPDGKTAVGEYTSYREGSAPMTGKVAFDRVGKAPKGLNAASGSWHFDHVISEGGPARTYTYHVDGNKIDYKSETMSYTGTIGGKAVPFMDGDKQDGTVSVKRVGKNVLRETFLDKSGKMRATSTMTLSTDGKSIKSSNYSAESKVTSTAVANKE
ncbi:hypothetical protein PY254_03000 [Rhodanobacter sp. AS-Z3]|uniref:hypothetical protein n=1 Tax=Rhodanobacter sp. AS-Z3 TaxID=3031330 RepID=UPI00247A7A79|nr:hypothetical protein [Rhodanobacter sp. AS-Z3]WEN15660.1 hypothetical protein PY254_03000 [Rhodanobacter sp. AS-Z3]